MQVKPTFTLHGNTLLWTKKLFVSPSQREYASEMITGGNIVRTRGGWYTYHQFEYFGSKQFRRKRTQLVSMKATYLPALCHSISRESLVSRNQDEMEA